MVTQDLFTLFHVLIKYIYCIADNTDKWYMISNRVGSHHNTNSFQCELEQLEHLRSEDTPHRLVITHTIESYWIPSQKKTKSKLQILNLQIFLFWNGHYTRHTLWCCSIRCANMKWIRWVLLKIQSGHDSVHRRTDGQTDKVILRWSWGYKN